MDPQERVFLETVWACLEDAGYTRARLQDPTAPDRRASVGVFVGVSLTDYQMHGGEAWGRGDIMPVNSQIYALANRVSYFLNLGGPSLPVDTACSSSLSALHLACESLRRGECRMALAGGVNLSLHPNKYLTLCLGQFAASDGRCRAFGEGGDGYVPAEGVGAVLLKPLAAALRDGDPIRAVIRGTAVNHDGKTHGFTVPNPVAQTEVVRLALRQAGLPADAISYIEAHGTGTALGDPIEIAGLTAAFAPDTAGKQFCAVGSVKSNIGHAEAAAGMAQLFKVILQLEHRTLVPNLLHSERTNRRIDFTQTPFYVQLGCSPWQPQGREPDDARRLRAGVSSFGVGGVNVHAIVEEAPTRLAREREEAGPVLLPLSAKSEGSLRAGVTQLHDFLVRAQVAGVAPRLSDVAYTLQVGREPMPLRLACTAATIDEAIARLGELALQPVPAREATGPAAAPFGSDAEDRAFLRTLAAERKWEKLARLWTEGAKIDWEEFYAHETKPLRISLPTYAFQRERYWQFEPRPDAAPTPAAAPPEIAASATSGTLRERLANAAPPERLLILTAHVQTVVGELLAFAPPNAAPLDKGLFDLGMESVQNAQLVARLAGDTGIELYPTVTFDYPNVRALATHLAHKFADAPAVVSAKPSAPETPVAAETFFVHDGWVAANTPLVPTAGPEVGAVLVLAGDDEAATAVVEALRARGLGGRVVTVRAGYAFARDGDDAFTIDPRVPAHYAQLIDALGRDGAGALRVLHGWSTKPFSTHAEILPTQIERGAYAIFHLTQALMRRTTKGAVRLVSASARREEGAPHATALRALLRSVSQENPAYDYRLVECVRDSGDGLTRADWAACVDELLRPEAGGEVRHEPGRRLVRELREFTLAPGDDSMLKPRGVCVITGGLGGLGSLVAEHLARTRQARLVLSGRSAGTGREAFFHKLEALGAEVIYVQADIATRAGADALVAAAKARFGQIDGVIHAAGVLRDAFVPTKKFSDWPEVLAPKVFGTVQLDEATRDEPLQFFAVFSSLTAAVGNAGQSDYAYANSFQEQFVEWRAQRAAAGTRAGKSLAINWPLWADGGMKVDAAMQGFLREVIGLEVLPAETGLRIFEQALGSAENSFTVLHGARERIAGHLKLRLRTARDESAAPLTEAGLQAAIEAELKEVSKLLGRGEEGAPNHG